MDLKSLIKLDDEVRPFSRTYVAEKLVGIKNKVQFDNSDFN